MPQADLPPEIELCRSRLREALYRLKPRQPISGADRMRLFLGTRTNAGRSLKNYCLVYFLLVDLLDFGHSGQEEKVAWSIPVEFNGNLYCIEYRKMGLGIFEPPSDPSATRSGSPTEQGELEATEICKMVNDAIDAATPYFEWRAAQAAGGSSLNVINNSGWLEARYSFFRDEFYRLDKLRVQEHQTKQYTQAWATQRSAAWNAQAAIDAFFAWSEHVFIHLAILQGKIGTGEQVRSAAGSDWKSKYKLALDLSDPLFKSSYDELLDLRFQIRNFMAHGSFGKRGEAFHFHSGTGAVPLLINQDNNHPYAFSSRPSFNEPEAIETIERFIDTLWSSVLSPAKMYLDSDLPLILTYVHNGTYAQAMQSQTEMTDFVDGLTRMSDIAADMDW